MKENLQNSNNCPCSPGSTWIPPAFVGNDYFCESGCPGNFQRRLYPDPLWDGEGCGSLETVCCQAAGLPWFHKRLSAATSDNIEMRICISTTVHLMMRTFQLATMTFMSSEKQQSNRCYCALDTSTNCCERCDIVLVVSNVM